MKKDTLLDFLPAVIGYCQTQFPRKCGNCQKEFRDFKQFVEETSPAGAAPVHYEIGKETDPIMLLSYTDCLCGNTIALRCDEAMKQTKEQFLNALKQQSADEGRPEEEILAEFRKEVRKKIGEMA